MPKPTDKFASLDAGKFSLGQPGNYTIDFTGGTVTVSRGGGTSFTDAAFGALTDVDLSRANKINLTGINFTDAQQAANNRFEPDSPLNNFIKATLADHGVAGTLDLLSVDGGKAGVFQLIWDYIDDNYSYYNTQINAYGVELGLAYADYLQAGGTALTNVVAKFTPDGPDAGTNPDRLQSMHDNILGNLDINSIIDKFFDSNAGNGTPNAPSGYFTGGSNGGANGIADEATGNQLLAAVFAADLADRPYYGGYEGTSATATILWDVDNGLLPTP